MHQQRIGLTVFCGLLAIWPAFTMHAAGLRVATFQIDVTPPVGTPLCDALVVPSIAVDDPLSARGMVLLPVDQLPIVLLAVDWVGIGNEGYDVWRKALAAAAATHVDRVCVHALHQHDAPGCDFLADRLAADVGLEGQLFDTQFARQCIDRSAAALRDALSAPQEVTGLALGEAEVKKVASNRRILGPDGKVLHVRYTSCPDPEVRAFPEGTIDPLVKLVEFSNPQGTLAVLTYYATHPQSHYGKGRVSADFVGMARRAREEDVPGPVHIHFNGAGGNIGAGKYNDGSPENRPILADRLAAGMRRAWEDRQPLAVHDLELQWDTREVQLPPAPWIDEASLRASIDNPQTDQSQRLRDIRHLAWLRRCQSGHKVTLARLRLGPLDILHLPGELFVEFQLAAAALRPEAFVCTAAYGDYGMGYIGVAEAYSQGGYETGMASRVSPRAEEVLMRAIGELMQ